MGASSAGSQNLVGQVGPGQEVFEIISRDESGRLKSSHGTGRVGSGQVGSGVFFYLNGRDGTGYPESSWPVTRP